MVEAYQDRVFNVIYRMVGVREEAEDLAQEVFVSVFKSIDQFRGDAKLSTWLFRVAVNHCKTRIKSLARRHDKQTGELDDAAERRSVAIGSDPVGAGRIDRPDQAFEGAETDLIVQRAIADLD